MKTKLTAAAMAAIMSVSAVVPVGTVAYARDRHTYYGKHRHHYHYRCKRSSGTTGAILGGVGGGVVGNALGGGVLGTVAGAAGGALLGKHLDKKHDAAQNRRNGC